MRSGEDRIKKLVSKSKVVDTAKDIPDHLIVEVKSLDDFERMKGQLYFCEEDQAFYKKGGANWMRYAYKPEEQQSERMYQETSLPDFGEKPSQEEKDPFGSPFDSIQEEPEPKEDKVFELEKKVFELTATVDAMKEWQENTIQWAYQMKEWVQKNNDSLHAEINKIKVAQDEGFITLKDNYELKIEELRRQIETWVQKINSRK